MLKGGFSSYGIIIATYITERYYTLIVSIQKSLRLFREISILVTLNVNQNNQWTRMIYLIV